jgi:hypothetical protein
MRLEAHEETLAAQRGEWNSPGGYVVIYAKRDTPYANRGGWVS